MNKRHKASAVFVSACFVLFLLTVMIGTVFREKETYSFYENRTLAAMPEMTRETLLTGEWGSGVEKYLSDHTAGRRKLLLMDTMINYHILHQPRINDVIVTEDCLLPEIPEWMNDTSPIPAKVEVITENLTALNDLVESYGGKYYYVATPCQYVFHADDYPWYLSNGSEYTEKSVSALTRSLEEAGVNFIDMGKTFARLGWADELSSKVDNHYSIYGAYLTYLAIMERIEADTGLDLPVLRGDNYTIETLPNPYLGSRTRKMLGLWPSDEKLSILRPVESIPFTRKDNGHERDTSVYQMPATPYEEVLYRLYMGGDTAFTEIDTGRGQLPSILIYGDSFTNPVECILYTGFDKMYSLDLRHYKDMSLSEFIEQHRPDIVVCIRDYQALLTPDGNGCGPTPMTDSN